MLSILNRVLRCLKSFKTKKKEFIVTYNKDLKHDLSSGPL